MADTISLPDDVSASKPVTWKPVRELADAISKLYADKEIFGLDDLATTSKQPATILSEWSTRITDTFANVCTNDSSIDGCVYLTEDVTAPFRLDKLGESGDLAPKCIAFEFAYDIDAYNAYLEGSKLPILTTQYLIYYELLSNPDDNNGGHIAITSFNIAEELAAEGRPSLNHTTVCNLIESHRDKIKKFWKPNDEGTAEDTYAKNPEIAGELYLKIKDPAGSECSTVTRVAFAGLNKNGNGNSGSTASVSKVSGYIGDTRKFLSEGKSGWMYEGEGIAVTLTGVSMNRLWGDPIGEQGFLPEADDEDYSTYEAPPIGCCSLCTWPSIGTEGGGGSNTFFNPSILKNYINWADWRAEYQKELTSEDINNSSAENVDADEIPEGRFPCHLGENKPANVAASYNYNSYTTTPSYTTYFQRWLRVSDNVYVRVAPLKFNGSSGKHAYLVVPITIGVALEPISYQPAIRKRWYDMIYYSLRNIAGYKHHNQETGDTKIIGVTWNTTNDSTNSTIKSIDVEKYLNPCASNGNLDDKCNCNTCKFERWKYLNLGGEGWETNGSDTDPFVGTPKDFEKYNKPDSKNCSQMWLWDQDRYDSIKKKVEAADADYLFPELYFEKLICYKNSSIFGANAGGFKMKEETADDTACGCTLCDEHDTETAYKLPWEGGGNNKTCEENGGDYLTHAETFNKLNYLAKFILDYKLPETTTRALDKLEIGNCFSYATAGKGNIKFTNAEPKITITYASSGAHRCITKKGITYTLPIVAPYYQTLASDEKFEIKKEGTSSSIETKEEAYGYNAYVWKAFDPGGLRENQDKDLKIIFTHYRPARVCSSPTLIDIDKSYIKKIGSCADYPLYLDADCQYTDSEWDFTSDWRTAYPLCDSTSCEYNPNKKHACGDAESNKELWAEVMWWALQDPENSVVDIKGEANPDSDDPNDPPFEYISWLPASCAGAIPMWSRDNSETSIGTIDIYLAPVPKSKGGDKHSYMAKYLGSCQFKINCNDEDKTEFIEVCNPDFITCCDEDWNYHDPKNAKTVIGTDYILNTSDQKITYTDTYGVASSSSVIKTKITHPPSTEDNDYLEAEITIPSDLLINKSAAEEGAKVYDDQRQQYIILAHRASHTHINSWLTNSNSKEVDLKTENKLKTWATMYASACRYAVFNTNFTFERTDT